MAPEASSAKDSGAKAFGRLVDRVLDGRVVPFLGAGISRNARVPGEDKFKPDVWWMAEQVRDALGKSEELKRIPEEGDARKTLVGLLDKFDKSKDPKLDQAADIFTWLCGATRLCKALRIDQFARLVPLPAHRFLAYFAREELITEMITTNYDTCIEQAFRASFSSGPPEESARAEDALAVIWSLSHYRAHGGQSRTARTGDPVLHLYKINGDADDYQKAEKAFERDPKPEPLKESAERIILTERQLQTFRDELWARDLFADRARSRALLFCGFGSEEPQVRHYAMLLMEEMQRQSQPVPEWTSIPELPNAPFLAAFEDTLSFPQMQIMVGFASAHVRPSSPPNGAPMMEAAFTNVFLGPFASFLRDGATDAKGLPADLFFQKLFQAVWLRHAILELSPGHTLHSWLRSAIPAHGAWTGWLEGELRRKKGKDDKKQGDRYEALFGCTDELLDPGKSNGPTPLMRWLHAVYTGGATLDDSTDFYLPLREEPLLTLLTLLLVTWIRPELRWEGIDAAPGLGLRVPLPDDCPVGAVYLAREGVLLDPSRYAERLRGSAWIITVPGTTVPHDGDTAPVAVGSPLTTAKIVRRTAVEVLRKARVPRESPWEVLQAVFGTPAGGEVP